MATRKTYKFPEDPLLVKLLIAAQNTSGSQSIIYDTYGFEKTYPQLLGDILHMGNLFRARLPPWAVNERGILREETPYVAVLVRSGYEFIVSFFAIRAIGGACMPFSSAILPEEAEYFISQTKATWMLVGQDCMERAEKIRAYVNEHEDSGSLALLPVLCTGEPIEIIDVGIDDTLQMAPEGPGMIMFTSGTTGLPKGAVLPRRCFASTSVQVDEPNSTAINYRPCHWLGGAESLIEPMLTGMKLYAIGEKADAEAVLETFKKHRITCASFSPTLLRQIKDLLTDENAQVPKEEQQECSSYFRGLSIIRCIAGMPELSTIKFWTGMTGLPFENVYGTTELGGAVTRAISKIKDSIGKPIPGIKVKLSDGNHGEIYVKSPNMFTHYIGDEKATRAAFNEDGYFKTGDLAELRDGEYVFGGRANADYVLFRSFQISTLKVESGLMDLPYISEACAVAVPDHESKQLCGIIVRLRRGSTPLEQITLTRIRCDLSSSLAAYMLPTLLRVMKDEEELPRTFSGKPIKRQIVEDYFGTTDWFPAQTPPPMVECWGKMLGISKMEIKPWDWSAKQRAD